MTKKRIIISLGGSLIVPSAGIDWKYLRRFRTFVTDQIAKGTTLYVVVGGGSTARQYITAAAKTIAITDEDKDWLGIHSSRLNAHLVRTIFYDVAHPRIITHPDVPMKSKEPVVIAAGWRPGWSTDYVAVQLAKTYKIKSLINLSNIDYAYDRDPSQFKDARTIKKITWADFRKIVGYTWRPGLSRPFDPIASGLAEELGLAVVIMNGKKLKNVECFLDDKPFKGTVISPA